MLGSAYNSPQGYAAERSCPNGRVHRCNAVTETGICGGGHHNAVGHQEAVDSSKGTGSKGKGKGKNKKGGKGR